MVVLTEEMVTARSKQTKLDNITKFNCWGAQLSDVSVLRRMPNVTVLSLSVNNIYTLADFQYCVKLQDLFVRKNNIRDLNEVCYLKDLTCLKSIFLDENPCVINCKNEDYRFSVIRTLPQLQKLDNTPVEPTEAERAVRIGKALVHPEQQKEFYSDPDDERPTKIYIGEKGSNVASVRLAQGWQEPKSSDRDRSPKPPHYQHIQQTQNLVNHDNDESTTVGFQDSYANGIPKKSPETVEPQQLSSSSSIKFEESLDVYSSSINMRNNQHYNSVPRCRAADGELGYCQEYNRRYNRSSCTNSCGRRRPAERKTNILNAVLCLIKEFDHHNLEVVKMAVKCRMDELNGSKLLKPKSTRYSNKVISVHKNIE